jgi:hypothetical protein
MTSPIDPIRRAILARRAARPEEPDEDVSETPEAGLPAPVSDAKPKPPIGDRPTGGSIFDAQLMGQQNQKRGLRAGQPLFDAAKTSYSKTEWSGSKDRRSGRGRTKKTEI